MTKKITHDRIACPIWSLLSWVQVFGNEIEQVWRARLMTYRPVAFEAVTQPRLLVKAWRQLRGHLA